jgi:predicted ferric reductase
MLAHAIVYIHYWSITNNEYQLKYLVQRMAYVSAFAMLILLGTTFLLRKKQYELFHILHILLAVMIITTAALHRPDIATHSVIILITAGSIWGLDRVLRFSKFSFSAIGNTATITPLPHSGTRIVLKKKIPFAVPGNHVFLWVPGVRSTESHPFTIISTNPVEMVVAAHDGFTQELHTYASQNPGKALLASVDGPYGTVPDFTSFTKVLFVAGGSGASFTFGVAVDLVRKLGESTGTTIEFIWVMKDQDQLTWFSTHLKTLASSPLVTLKIHSTSPPSTPVSQLEPKNVANSILTAESDPDLEKADASINSWSFNSVKLQHGRPKVADCIKQAVEGASKSDRIAVAACGPNEMMLETRRTVAGCISVNGPAIELHSEHFGW